MDDGILGTAPGDWQEALRRSERIIKTPADRRDAMFEKRMLEYARQAFRREQQQRGNDAFASMIAELDVYITARKNEIARFDAVRNGYSHPRDGLENTIIVLRETPRTLIETRLALDLTLIAVGKKLGMTTSALCRLEKSHFKSASLTTVTDVAVALASFVP